MSKVRVCDRCGKRLERDYGWFVGIRAFKFHYFTIESECEYMFDHHDLCPCCKKQYDAFMKGEAIPSIEEEKTNAVD